jgi:hypothetical protein
LRPEAARRQRGPTPGQTEAERERDVGASIRRTRLGAPGEAQGHLGRPEFGAVDPDKGFPGHLVEPPNAPGWRDAADIAHVTAEFTRRGFRGGHILDGAAHWRQRERALAVGSLRVDFLERQ